MDYSNHTSLHNWVEQLDLVCTGGNKIGLIGSMFFAGWVTTTLVLPPLADKIGRKWIVTISMLVTAGSMATMYISKSLALTITMMFLAGAATSGRTAVGYIYANEFLTPRWQVAYGTAFNIIDGGTYLILTFYYDFIDNHYMYISVFGFIFACIGLLGLFTFIAESPLWQLKMGELLRAQLTLKKMMRINNVECDDEIEMLASSADIKVPRINISN